MHLAVGGLAQGFICRRIPGAQKNAAASFWLQQPGRASRQERCKTLEKARGEAFSAAFRYLDGCRAAFVRHAGLYAKDCGRAFLFGKRLHVIPAAFVPRDGAPRRLSHAERLRRLTYRPFLVRPARLCNADARLARRSAQFRSFARSVCAAGHPAAICVRCSADLLFGARCTVPCAAVLLCPTDSIRRRPRLHRLTHRQRLSYAWIDAKDCGRAFLVWRACARRTGGICAARWRAASALARGAFAPRTSGRDLVRCQLICFSARGASRAGSVRPARRTLRKRLRRAFLFGERLHVIPAAFVPRDGAPPAHAERLRRLTRRVGSLTRSVCAAGVRPRFVFDAS